MGKILEGFFDVSFSGKVAFCCPKYQSEVKRVEKFISDQIFRKQG
jgi:hypothetical protein